MTRATPATASMSPPLTKGVINLTAQANKGHVYAHQGVRAAAMPNRSVTRASRIANWRGSVSRYPGHWSPNSGSLATGPTSGRPANVCYASDRYRNDEPLKATRRAKEQLHRYRGSLQLFASEKVGGWRSSPQIRLPARWGVSRKFLFRSQKYLSIAALASSLDW